MRLTVGDTLAQYEITKLLGKGGMGEVYQARDRKLGRDVAIKVLPDKFDQDPERVARFEREARVLASLNHPNIASLYGMEESNGTRCLVLELVEGETLAERVRRGPIPSAEALKAAHQIACALEAAHEKGITHRDLKPANIKITGEGRVKVLDFGLAKATERASTDDPSDSPTMSIVSTNAGVVLGTAAYMSPEQANGLSVDSRSDLFSLGSVLYEMLSGRQPFQGKTLTEVIASVLVREPDWSSLPQDLNPRLKELLQRCLEKDVTRRWQAAGDVRVEIEKLLSIPAGTVITSPAPTAARPRSAWKSAIPVLLVGTIAAVAAVILTWNLKPSAPAAVTRLQLVLPGDQVFTQSERRLLAISPDGAKLAYVANNQIFLRQMSETEATPVAGASGAVANPLFSPDGRWILFWSISDSRLKKVAISGGNAIPICESRALFGAAWSRDKIVFGEGGKGIMRVAENGGEPELLVGVKPEEGTASDPQMIDGDRAVLFTLATGEGPDRWDQAKIVAQPLPSGARKVLFTGSDAHYLPSGHLIYAQRGNVLAAPFDTRKLEANGNPVSVIEGVWRATSGLTGDAHLVVADSGALAFIPGGPGGAAVRTTLALIDQAGKMEPLPIASGQFVHPRVSPDGKKLAVMTDDGTEQRIWIYELSGGAEPRPLTFGGRNRYPVWSHDGTYVIFTSDREGDNGLFRQRADGTGAPERLTRSDPGSAHFALSVDRSGGILAYYNAKRGATGIWILPLDGSGAAKAFPEAPNVAQPTASFSPDGRFLAYSTTELGPTPQIFFRSYQNPDSKYQITTEGGGMPAFSANNKQMVYLGGPNRYLSLDIQSDPPGASGKPAQLPISGIIQPLPGMRNYDVTPDGKLLVVVPGFSRNETNPRPLLQINVVLNWFRELQQRVPVK